MLYNLVEVYSETTANIWLDMRLLLITILFIICTTAALASDNAVVVINAESSSSKLVGNFYIHERNIPAENVVYLSNIPVKNSISILEFRKLILEPILATMDERKLGGRVDYVVYSSDFPTIISARKDLKAITKDPKKSLGGAGTGKVFTPHISINAATYFYQRVTKKEVSYLSLGANTYYRTDTNTLLSRPFIGADQNEFSAATKAAGDGEFDEAIEILESLAKKHPQQLAVLYWLARSHAWKGDVSLANNWLLRSVYAGWCFRDYTLLDTAFQKIENDPDFKKIIKLIPPVPFHGGPTIGFRNNFFWGPNGMINSTPDQGNRFLLSTVLAVHRNQGNSEQKSLAYLKRSIDADGTFPDGQFYFSKTKDVRSRTRIPPLDKAVEELKSLGFRSQIVSSTLPNNSKDIAGFQMGSARYDLSSANMRILPGAICDNLTSYGGRLGLSTKQTKLTEFLRHGAAGSSGTVVEPYAIQAKFPHPRIHAHYVRGCTLAEAFYQSVAGPFQLLIVGDALCKPWASIPKLKLSGDLLSSEPVAGEIEMNVKHDGQSAAVGLIEMYLDGRLIRRIPGSQINNIKLDTTTIPDGYHEFRFIPIGASPITTRGWLSAEIFVDNNEQDIELTSNTKVAKIDESIQFEARSEGAKKIILLHNQRVIKEVEGDTVSVKVPAFFFGRGTVKVEAVAQHEQYVRSRPLELKITGPISTTIPTVNLK